MDMMKIRAVPGSSVHLVGDVTDVDDASHTVKVEFPHERVDSFKTTFGERCFEDSFRDQLPIMVWAHDLRDPIGHAIRAQVLPRHNEVIGQFDDLNDVPSAKRAYSQIKSGTITDFSFGYVNGPERPHPDPQLRRRGVRQIPRATMREFSPVAIGSIPGAKVAGIREDGNLVTADSPDTIRQLVADHVLTPAEGHEMLRELGYLSGVRASGPGSIGAPSGVPWTAADAAQHLMEAHGVNVYTAGLGTMTPQTLAVMHSQMGGDGHDHGQFTGYLAAIQASLDAAIAAGGSTWDQSGGSSQFGQEAKFPYLAAAGYQAMGGQVGGPGDASLAVAPGEIAAATAAGYQAAMATMAGRSAAPMRTRDGTDAQMYCQMAKDASAEAVGAANGGDAHRAAEKAKHARLHARRAQEQARPDDPMDLQAVRDAAMAAKTASDAADAATTSDAGAWNETPVRAEHLIELAEKYDPAMAVKLRQAHVALAPLSMSILFRSEDGSITDGSGDMVDYGAGATTEVTELALNVDAALDNARQWLEGVDTAALPEEAQQALALIGAAADGSEALVEVLGALPAGARAAADDDMSDEPWEFSEADYTPAQYRDAALIDTGEGAEDSKSRYALPIKEPSGKLNRRGIAAAATRLRQVAAPDAEKKKAARTLMSLYGKMKKPTPPNVLKVLGAGERAEASETAAELAAAQARLDERLAKRA